MSSRARWRASPAGRGPRMWWPWTPVKSGKFEAEARVLSRGPGSIFGEIGLLAFSSLDAARSLEAADRKLEAALDAAGDNLASLPSGVSSATCTALGAVELARLGRGDFLKL